MNKKSLYLYAALVIIFGAVNFGLFKLARPINRVPVKDSEETSAVPADSEGIRKVLAQVQDPELGINIVDLGLIRDIKVQPDHKAMITIIFTIPECPLMDSIVSEIEQRVKKIKGIEGVEVRVDSTVAWDKSMMTEKGQQAMKERSR